MKLYFAYGSNLNLPQMEVRCPGARPFAIAVLENWRLVFRGRETGFYLTVEPAPGWRVPGVLWPVGPQEEESLDAYEDYPVFYSKEPVSLACRSLETGEESRREAFVYRMREGFPLGLPTQDYMDACLEGYRTFGFDPVPLWEAYRLSGGEEEAQEDS